ncbi:MAG: hypothetical protein KC736_01340 [Candidatus Moranbacteria bacterium]|nr:hypothetical protein [Candidatus Moranbacteria bacterium]
MKRILCLLVVSFFAPFVWAQSNPSGCDSLEVSCVSHQFNKAGKYGDWAPEKGAILFFGNGDTTIFRHDETFQVYLYFDQQAIDFYNTYSWAGFEIDILFPDNNNYPLPFIRRESVSGPPWDGTVAGHYCQP